MTTSWTVRTKPTDDTVNVLFNDQFKTFNDPTVPFDGYIGFSTKWYTRIKP